MAAVSKSSRSPILVLLQAHSELSTESPSSRLPVRMCPFPSRASDSALITSRSKLKLRAAWEWLGRPSTDFAVLVSVFLVANAILCSTSFASPAMNHVASRYGWYFSPTLTMDLAEFVYYQESRLTRNHFRRIGAVNMTLCVFFGMKNTPLSFLSRVSHAEINILHRIVGYLACLLILGHAVLYTIHFGRKGDWHRFIEQADLAGIGAGIAMLVLLVMGLVRHRCYESFYFSHIASFAVTVFLVILHRPSWVKKLPYLMLFTLFIWLVDRTIRAATLTRNLLNNQATCYPLPGGGVRLLLNKSSAHVVPGSHCYLWIPRVRLYQMHPFTVVSNGPSGLELVIKAKSGYTKGLHDYATTHPGRPMHASIDGPYGSVPDTAKYDKLVLIAGGSGAAYTVGLLNRVMHSSGRMASQSIDFIWAVRSKGVFLAASRYQSWRGIVTDRGDRTSELVR